MSDRFRKILGMVKMGGWRRTSGRIAQGSKGRTPRQIAHKGARRALKAEMMEEVNDSN